MKFREKYLQNQPTSRSKRERDVVRKGKAKKKKKIFPSCDLAWFFNTLFIASYTSTIIIVVSRHSSFFHHHTETLPTLWKSVWIELNEWDVRRSQLSRVSQVVQCMVAHIFMMILAIPVGIDATITTTITKVLEKIKSFLAFQTRDLLVLRLLRCGSSQVVSCLANVRHYSLAGELWRCVMWRLDGSEWTRISLKFKC